MGIKRYEPFKTADVALRRVQDAVAVTLDSVTAEPFLNGVVLADIDVTTSGVSIAHGLGRAVRGWVVIKIDADANVWEEVGTFPTKFLLLTASAACRVSLWVF